MPTSPRGYKYELKPEDAVLLTKFERKPYRGYTLHDLIPSDKRSLTERMEETSELQSRLDHLVELGLLREERFYMSPKAKL